MTSLGVFRDDFYNAVSALAQSQVVATTAGTSTLPASSIAGAGDCYLDVSGGAAVTYTTDTAINIIAAIQIAVANAYKQGLGSFAAGVNPPSGVPNLFNTSWTLTINNQNSASITLTAGTGVTLVGTNAGTIVTVTSRVYVVTVTSPTTVTIQSVGAFLSTAP
jgi:hypothetical protein